MQRVTELEECRPLIREQLPFQLEMPASSEPLQKFCEQLSGGAYPVEMPESQYSAFVGFLPQLGQIVSYSRFHQYHIHLTLDAGLLQLTFEV
jgi:hypothetical protein